LTFNAIPAGKHISEVILLQLSY